MFGTTLLWLFGRHISISLQIVLLLPPDTGTRHHRVADTEMEM